MKHFLAPLVVCLFACTSALAQVTQPTSLNLDHAALKKLGWQFAVRTDAFGSDTLFDVIDRLHKLNVHHLELAHGQLLSQEHKDWLVGPEMKQPEIDALLAKLKGVKMDAVTYYAAGLNADEAKLRPLFDWAKKLKLKTIVCEPDETALAILDKLANEYGINVAVTSGPAPASYPTCLDVVRAVSGRSMKVGVCADIVVWRFGGEDPTKCIKSLDGRIFELRVKGVQSHEADYEATLKELKAQNFKGVLVSIPSGSGAEAATISVTESVNQLSPMLTKLSSEK